MAHGLALGLVDMVHRERASKKVDPYEIISEDDKFIRLWMNASNKPRFYNLEFYQLVRETLLFVFSSRHVNVPKRKELIKAVASYFNALSDAPKKVFDLKKFLLDAVSDPWKNSYFAWDDLFKGKISVSDPKVQEYLILEPEDILMARVHSFAIQGCEEIAMNLARYSYFYHSRVAKHLFVDQFGSKLKSESVILDKKSVEGIASMDWYLFLLQRKKSLPAIIKEVKQLKCHEGVQLIQRLRRRSKKNQSFIFTLLQILIIQELIQPSTFCCTKKMFSLWVIMHLRKKSGVMEINQGLRKLLGGFAPSSAHFYLMAHVLWEQGKESLITPIVELFVRGLTVDINHLEAAKNREDQEDVNYLENHIALIFHKLSTLFTDFDENAARECMLSAFSLKPNKERLYILQSLTHSILSAANSNQMCFSNSVNVTKQSSNHCLEHPILNKSVSHVPYLLLTDLVTVLEGVRCFQFQYNIFSWHNDGTDLGNYLRDFNLMKSWESDTEYASEGSNKGDIDDGSPEKSTYPVICSPEKTPYPIPQVFKPLQLSAKRKVEQHVARELLSLDVGRNIEVDEMNNANKRIKSFEQITSSNIDKQIAFNNQINPIFQSLDSSVGMEDAIENVIRMTLHGKQRPDLLSNNNIVNMSVDHLNDGNQILSPLSKPMSDIQSHSYSVTSSIKRKDFDSTTNPPEFSSSAKSNMVNKSEYVSDFATKPSEHFHRTQSPHAMSRDTVISPVMNPHKKFITVQEHSSKPSQNSYFSAQAMHVPGYSDNRYLTSNIRAIQKMSVDTKKVPAFQNMSQNSSSVNNNSLIMYERAKNFNNANAQSSHLVSSKATVVHTPNPLNLSISTFSKSKFSPHSSVSSSSSMVSSAVGQSKELSIQNPAFPSSCQSSVYRSDSRYQYADHSVGNARVKRTDESTSCYQEDQLMHNDRNSVIQHTMQHVGESFVSHERKDFQFPRQLSVSVKTDAAEQIRCTSKKGIRNLPPFTVNVSDKNISNTVVSASLVIAKKPHCSTEESTSQQISSSPTTVTSSDTITIPGILASPSVIVTPWETQQKRHGEMMYKKTASVPNIVNVEKRIYKNRPYSNKIIYMGDPKLLQKAVPFDKNTQLIKAITSPRHSSPALGASSSKNNETNNNQNWIAKNKMIGQVNSEPSSSQPWYSVPYPKPSTGNNTAFTTTATADNGVRQQTASHIKICQPVKQHANTKVFPTCKKSIHANISASSSVTHVLHNPVSQSLVKSSTLNTTNVSLNVNTHIEAQASILHRHLISSPNSQPSNTEVIKSLYDAQNSKKKYLSKSSTQYADNHNMVPIEEKNPTAFHVSNVGANHQYCRSSSENFSNSCCSPSEINPCQNCSLPPAEINVASTSSLKNLENVPEQNSSGAKMNSLVSSTYCYSSQSRDDSDDTRIMLPFSNINEAITMCQFCSQYFVSSELEMHIFNSHAEEFDHANYVTAMGSCNAVLENASISVKPLPDVVPEQDSLFQKESLQANLPQTKPTESSVVNQLCVPEDVKNMDDVTFNTYMDLINNDKDLKKIVQGIDTLDHIDNNYLPFMDTTVTQNYLKTDLPDQIQNINLPEIPLQVTDEDQEMFNNYSVQCSNPHLKSDEVNSQNMHGNVFEFTEKDFEASRPAHKLVHSKPVTSFSENNLPSDSKNTNEVSFSTLAQIFKDTINDSEDCNNMLESYEIEAKYNVKNNAEEVINPLRNELDMWSCKFCGKRLKSSHSLKRHIRKLHSDQCAENVSVSKLDALHPTDSFTSLSPTNNDSMSSVNMENNSLVPLTPKLDISSTLKDSEIKSALPKGRIKGIIKSKTCKCQFCDRILTLNYMKKHIQKQHPDQEYSAISIKNDNSLLVLNGSNVNSATQIDTSGSKLDLKCNQEKQYEQQLNAISVKNENSVSDLSADANISSTSQADASNITAVTSLVEPDIDSSTCLSVSDAKRNGSYTITDASNLSTEADKVSESTNVKFNFNEISKDVDAKASTSKEDQNLFPTLNEPCLTSGNVSEPEEAKVKPIVSYTKQSGFKLKKFLCHMCTKAYASNANLKNHLKRVHNIEVPSQKQSKKSISLGSVSNVHSASNITGGDVKKSLLHVSKVTPRPTITLLHKSGDKQNNSLLKKVLNTNFMTKQLEAKRSEEIKENISCKETNTILPKTTIDESKMFSDELSIKNPSDCNEKCEFVKPNAPLCSDILPDKLSDVISSEDIIKSPNTEKRNISGIVPLDVQNNELPSATVKLQRCELNSMLCVSDKIKPFIPEFTCDVSFENSTVQSNEISPISEIISNISKCHFGGAADKGKDEKILLDDNSLKLVIPENQKNSANLENKFITLPLQENLNEIEVKHESEKIQLAVEKCETTQEELLKDGSEVANFENKQESVKSISEKTGEQKVPRNSQVNEIVCRLCQQTLKSMIGLTKHLKEIHHIPVLKRKISKQLTPKLTAYHKESEKLSPPKLKLGPNETDSESVSDSDNLHTVSKVVNDSFVNAASIPQVTVSENSCILPLLSLEQSVQKERTLDSTCENLNSFVQHESTETERQPKQPDSLSSISKTECPVKSLTAFTSCKYKFRRNSFSDTLPSDIKCKNACGILKVKSLSLPNFQVALNVTTSRIEHDLNETDTSVKILDLVPGENAKNPLKQSEAEHSSGEYTSFSNVTDATEVSRTSCDSSSGNCPIAISVNSDFLLPNPILKHVSKISSSTNKNKTVNKFALKKIQSFRQRKMRKVKNDHLRCDKMSKQRKYKPIIITLKKATEISEFLKTHKQPTVKLVRLKEDYSIQNFPNKKLSIIGKNSMKKAVVKIEKLHIPSNDLLFGNRKLIVSHVVKKSRLSSLKTRGPKNQSIKCPKHIHQHSHRSSLPKALIKHANSPEIIDLTEDSNDATSFDNQNVETLSVEINYPVITERCCLAPPIKNCFVVLKRVSV